MKTEYENAQKWNKRPDNSTTTVIWDLRTPFPFD